MANRPSKLATPGAAGSGGPGRRPITSHLDFSSSMLLGNFCSVSGWFFIPLANKLYGPWVHGPKSTKVEVLAPLSAVAVLLVVWFLNRG